MGGVNSLSDAVWAGDMDAVDAAIRAGADVNASEGDRWPPLHLAIEQMEVEIARRLINAGASVNRDLGGDWTPLAHAVDIESDSACQAGLTLSQLSTSLTALLLEHGAIPTERPVAIARQYGNPKTLALLISANPQMSEKDAEGKRS